MKPGGQQVQLFGSACGVGFNAAVVEVTDPATGDPDTAGAFFNEPSETDALHSSGHQPTPGHHPSCH
jgi:hypothetical protein